MLFCLLLIGATFAYSLSALFFGVVIQFNEPQSLLFLGVNDLLTYPLSIVFLEGGFIKSVFRTYEAINTLF